MASSLFCFQYLHLIYLIRNAILRWLYVSETQYGTHFILIFNIFKRCSIQDLFNSISGQAVNYPAENININKINSKATEKNCSLSREFRNKTSLPVQNRNRGRKRKLCRCRKRRVNILVFFNHYYPMIDTHV